jgi:tetratricopeptide (TPR) repeat protein
VRAVPVALSALFSLCAVGALAEPQRFWDRVAQPHARRVDTLTGEGRDLVERAGSLRTPEQAGRRRDLLEEAAERFTSAAALSPDSAGPRLELGLVLSEVGEYARAAVVFGDWHNLATDGGHDADAALRWGRVLLRQRRFADATAVLERALVDAGAGDRPQLLLLAGYVHLSAGRIEDATDAFERATRSSAPGSDLMIAAYAQLGLAVAYDRDEQLGKAAEALAAARAADPTLAAPLSLASVGGLFPFTPATDLHYFRALAYEATGRREEALVEWRAYAASAEPRHGARAQEHIRALTAVRK